MGYAFLLYIVQQSIFSAFFFCIEYTVSNNLDFLYVFHESDMLPYCTVPSKKKASAYVCHVTDMLPYCIMPNNSDFRNEIQYTSKIHTRI
jgi:hypothetical protein